MGTSGGGHAAMWTDASGFCRVADDRLTGVRF